MKNHTKIFLFMTFHIKLQLVQNLCVLDSIKQMDLLEFIMELDIKYYQALKKMMLFTTELDIL